MCGIAGIVDLTGRRQPDPAVLQAMAQSLWHRGPDDDGFLIRPGFGFANRRLSIVGLGDGRQPIFNEDSSVAVVFNGELFDYPERKAELQAKGHVFRTHTDTELIVHLYEDHGEGVFTELKGQFALALVDSISRSKSALRTRSVHGANGASPSAIATAISPSRFSRLLRRRFCTSSARSPSGIPRAISA